MENLHENMPEPQPDDVSADLDASLAPLLAHLADSSQPDSWRDWRILSITGGKNNRVYRATNQLHDLAIKWTIRDARRRAWREHTALHALAHLGLPIAPRPLLLDEQAPQPVVVQTWLAGAVAAEPPSSDDEWLRLLEHYAAIHGVRPDMVPFDLPPAVLTARTPDDCRAVIRQQLDLLPPSARPSRLGTLLSQLDHHLRRSWKPVPLALCRVDANTLNIVRRPDAWASVDWENSGWGDPAFEIADLITHPAYATVEGARWRWVREHYCALVGDESAMARIDAYECTMRVFWVVRFARTLHDIPRGDDLRLVEHPANWREDAERKLAAALRRCAATLGVD